MVDQFPHQKLLALGRLLLINPRPLHPQLFHVAQQQVLLVVDVALLTSLYRLHQSHPHHINPELRLRTYCQDTFIHVLQA